MAACWGTIWLVGGKLLLRVGEATNPGPSPQDRPGGRPTCPRDLKVMTINAGGWAPVVDSLALGIYDIVLVQETWLLEGSIRSAAFSGADGI
eukprot:4640637-Amphidinium_carterae.1